MTYSFSLPDPITMQIDFALKATYTTLTLKGIRSIKIKYREKTVIAV
jgi:hypothetical protein